MRPMILALSLLLLPSLATADEVPGGAPPPVSVDVAPSPLDVPSSPADIPGALPVVEPVAVPAPVVTLPPVVEPVPTPAAALEQVGEVINAYRTGGYLAALAAAVVLLTMLIRLFGWLDLLPKRLRIVVPLALGCLGALLASASTGIPWLEAVTLALLTGPSAVALHQGLGRSLLGVESPQTSAIKNGL